MGLSTPVRPLFNMQWQAGLAKAVQPAQIATVQIYDPATSTSVFNPATNKFTNVPVVVYYGPARVQPVRGAGFSTNGVGDDTTIQGVRMQLPINATLGIDFRTKHRGKVIDSPLFPTLTKYVFTLREIMDSSNPFERTLEFDVNQEALQT